MFTDQVEIHVKSGKGGDGMVHFRREKFIPMGGPDGGDGGKGGDVIFEVKTTLNTLSSFRQNQKFKAEEGVKGGPSQMTGRNGKDLVIYVPPGTVLFDADTGELIGDLTKPGQELTVLKGGRGGRGNVGDGVMSGHALYDPLLRRTAQPRFVAYQRRKGNDRRH